MQDATMQLGPGGRQDAGPPWSGRDRSDLVDQAMPEPAPARRLEWVDVARGLTIILVVLFHAVRGVAGAGLLAPDSVLVPIDFAVYTFHMPAFFFFSGLFMRRTLDRPPGIFWPGRFRSLLLPYFLWLTVEAVFLGLTTSVSNMHGFHVSLGLYFWDPLAPFWFLYSLFLISAILYSARRLPNGALFALAVAAYALAWVWYAQAHYTLEVQTASGLLFVTLGMLFAKYTNRHLPQTASALLAVLLFAGVAVASLPVRAAGLRYEASLPSALMGVAGIILLAQFLDMSRLSRWLGPVRFLGRISLTILVVHILGTAGARIVLLKLFGVHSVALHMLIDTVAGLALGAAVQWAAWRIGATRWLGLPDVPVRLLPHAGLGAPASH